MNRQFLIVFLMSAAFVLGLGSNAYGGAIQDAAKKGDLEKIRMLVEKTPSLLNAVDKNDGAALHCAAWKDHLPVVGFLILKGANVNAKFSNDYTPLIMAIIGGDKDVVAFLIEKGADVGVKDKQYNLTPLHLAASKGNLQVVQILLDKGADPMAMAKNGIMSINSAANNGHAEVCQMIAAKDSRIADSLLARLGEKDVNMRVSAARVLGFTKDVRAVEPLIGMLKDEYQETHLIVALTLGLFEDPRAVDPLMEFAKSKEKVEREIALVALIMIGDRRATVIFRNALKNTDSNSGFWELRGWESSATPMMWNHF